MTKYSITFIIADHHRKPSKEHSSPEQNLRGSSDKAAFVDTLLTFSKNHDRITIQHTKSRTAKAVDSVVVEIIDSDLDSTTIQYIGLGKDYPKDDKASQAITDLLTIIDDQWKARKTVVKEAKVEFDLSSSKVDESLKLAVKAGKLEKKSEQTEGRGGKSDFYRKVEINTEHHESVDSNTARLLHE